VLEKQVTEIYQALQKLIGFHRQLREAVIAERKALVDADLKAIEAAVAMKQGLIEEIRRAEAYRVKMTAELAQIWRKDPAELTLSNLIIAVQGKDLKFAEQLRSALNAITVLIQHITESNDSNRSLVEKSLEHVHEMKKNILGESVPKSTTYTQQGQKSAGMQGARILSKEA
jgi:flagellar biosynthesis/type III secretory pathway chaperone